MNFEETFCFCCILLLPLFCEILGNMCIVTVCEAGCDVKTFEIKLIFLIKLFFLHDQKVFCQPATGFCPELHADQN